MRLPIYLLNLNLLIEREFTYAMLIKMRLPANTLLISGCKTP